MSELIVYQKAYSLLLDVFARTDGFPKSKRFSLGQRLESRLLDMITMLHGYRYVRNKVARAVEISACFDEVKLLLKIAHDAKSSPARPLHILLNALTRSTMLGLVQKTLKQINKRSKVKTGVSVILYVRCVCCAAGATTTIPTTCVRLTATTTTRATTTTTTAFVWFGRAGLQGVNTCR